MARSNTSLNPRRKPAKRLKSNTKKNTQTVSRSSGRTTKHDRVLGLLQEKGVSGGRLDLLAVLDHTNLSGTRLGDQP